MKKVNFYIFISILILILSIMVYYYLSSKNKVTQSNLNTPTPSIKREEQNPSLKTTLTEVQTAQLEADKEAGMIMKQRYDIPWYSKLPLQTDKYFIYFDTYEEKFIGTIFSSEEQVEIKNEVLNQFKNLGIESEKYEIDWKIK